MKKFACLAITVVAFACGAFTAHSGSNGVPFAVEYRGITDVKYKLPANNVWYECGRLTVPAGTWRLSYRVMAFSQRFQTDTGTVSAFARLSADGTTDRDWQTGGRTGGNQFRAIFTLQTERVVVVPTSTTYILSISESEGNNWSDLQCLGERSTTIIRAEQLT